MIGRAVFMGVALVVAAVCVRLGIWQLDRLGERRALNSMLESRLALPVLDLGAVAPRDSLHFRRADATGTWDFERQVVVVARQDGRVNGVHVLTPLVLPGARAVLVNRGFVAAPDGRTVDLSILDEADSARASGFLVEPGPESSNAQSVGSWPVLVRHPNMAELAARYPYQLVPALMVRDQRVPGQPEVLRAVGRPELSEGPHFSYAMQWFGFAAVFLIGGLVFTLRSGSGSGR